MIYDQTCYSSFHQNIEQIQYNEALAITNIDLNIAFKTALILSVRVEVI